MERLFEAQAAFQKADDDWHAALVDRYGKNAGTMRYLGQGAGMECEKIKAAYDARYAAMRAYMAMQDAAIA
jgi:lambda repressor-like predicted transcriptional regulator